MKIVRRHRWESLLALLVVAAAAGASALSPLYWNAEQILDALQQSTAVAGIVALGFALVILLGEIDVSLPAVVAMGTVTFGGSPRPERRSGSLCRLYWRPERRPEL